MKGTSGFELGLGLDLSTVKGGAKGVKFEDDDEEPELPINPKAIILVCATRFESTGAKPTKSTKSELITTRL